MNRCMVIHNKRLISSSIPYIKSPLNNITNNNNNNLPVDYLQKILTSRVYDVSIETPLQQAKGKESIINYI